MLFLKMTNQQNPQQIFFINPRNNFTSEFSPHTLKTIGYNVIGYNVHSSSDSHFKQQIEECNIVVAFLETITFETALQLGYALGKEKLVFGIGINFDPVFKDITHFVSAQSLFNKLAKMSFQSVKCSQCQIGTGETDHNKNEEGERLIVDQNENKDEVENEEAESQNEDEVDEAENPNENEEAESQNEDEHENETTRINQQQGKNTTMKKLFFIVLFLFLSFCGLFFLLF